MDCLHLKITPLFAQQWNDQITTVSGFPEWWNWYLRVIFCPGELVLQTSSTSTVQWFGFTFLEKFFSNFSLHQNHKDNSLKSRFLAPVSVFDSVGQGGVKNLNFLNKFPGHKFQAARLELNENYRSRAVIFTIELLLYTETIRVCSKSPKTGTPIY